MRKMKAKKIVVLCLSLCLGMGLVLLSGCGASSDEAGQREEQRVHAGQEAGEEGSGEDKNVDSDRIGLILTSRDAKENEAVTESFQKMAEEAGAELLVKMPDVTAEAAGEACGITGDFVLCDVDPIEFQMLYVNELVAEDVDVIAIHANHPDALEPVLAAARAVGMKVCAFGTELPKGCYDVYAGTEEAAEAAAELLK